MNPLPEGERRKCYTIPPCACFPGYRCVFHRSSLQPVPSKAELAVHLL